ncbi:MAG TPA: hypothetical protein PK095_21270, partial [Myxococcota bacterium]|nr:hypothetical protein [Myxococcota bacterium]
MMLAKMGIGEGVAMLAFGVVLIFGLAWVANARFAAARKKQALELGLQIDDKGDLRGELEGFAVEVVSFKTEAKREKDRQHKTRLTVSGGLPGDVHLGKAGLMATLKDRALARVGGPDVEIGSARFDERYVVKGEPRALFAMLDVEARERFTKALDEGWVFQDGAWVFEDYGLMTGDVVVSRVRTGVELAGWLRERAAFDVLPGVIERIRFDPEPEVRRNALSALIGEGGAQAVEVEALLDDLGRDEDPQMRLLVAKARRDTDTLTALALDPELKTMTRVEALGLLATLEDERLLVTASAVLGEPGTEAELRIAAVDTARWIGPRAEGMVIPALRDPEDRVSEAAVRALAVVGT